jgi:glycosyltransferase involved in cell wall biosynthesis
MSKQYNSDMKKILFLEQYSKLSGGQRVLLSIIDGLKDDYQAQVTVPEQGELTKELDKRDIKYHILPVGYYSLGKKTVKDVFLYLLRMPALIRKLKKIIEQERPDLVYANGARTFVFSAIACSETKTPLIWHVHSIFEGISRRLCNIFGKCNSVKRILAVSQAAAEPIAKLSSKTKIMYNAIDQQVFYPGDKNGLIRKSLGLGNEVTAAMVSLLVEWKCIDDFIKAAAIVSKGHPEVKFLIVGDVLYDEKGKQYKQYLLDLVDQLKLKDKVIFTGFRNDVPDIMRELDVFVLASKQPDPCPTALLQAMSSGTAVIATDFGGPAEIIADEKDGLLYKALDVKALADKIKSLVEDENMRKIISKNAAEKIVRDYSYTKYMQSLKQVIEELIPAGEDIYISGKYEEHNPSWHQEDAKWKADKIIEVIPDAVMADFKTSDKPLSIVDIGCGSGQILKNVADHFVKQNIKAEYKGYDLSSDIIAKARNNFPQAEFLGQEFKNNIYKHKPISLALIIDILEHLEQPGRLLQELKPVSDYIVCHIPLEDNFMVKSRGLKSRFKQTVGHINFYNQNTAVKLFTDAGYQIVNKIYTCSDCSADYKLASLPRRLILQPLRKLFFKISPSFTTDFLGNCSFMLLLRKTGS